MQAEAAADGELVDTLAMNYTSAYSRELLRRGSWAAERAAFRMNTRLADIAGFLARAVDARAVDARAADVAARPATGAAIEAALPRAPRAAVREPTERAAAGAREGMGSRSVEASSIRMPPDEQLSR